MSKEKTEKLNTILSLIEMDNLIPAHLANFEKNTQRLKTNCGFHWVSQHEKISLYFNKSWQDNSEWLSGFSERDTSAFFRKNLPLLHEYMHYVVVNHGYTLKVHCRIDIPDNNLDETIRLLLSESKSQGFETQPLPSPQLRRPGITTFRAVVNMSENTSQSPACLQI